MSILLLREAQRHKITEDSLIQCFRVDGKIKEDRFAIRRLFPACRFKLNEMDKHVDAIGVCCRTRVRVPPSPISDDSSKYFSSVILNREVDYFIGISGGVIYNSKMFKPCDKIKIEERYHEVVISFGNISHIKKII